MIAPTLHTARLRLEPLSETHSAGMFELWSAPEVCRFAGRVIDWAGQVLALPARSATVSDRIIEVFARHAAAG